MTDRRPHASARPRLLLPAVLGVVCLSLPLWLMGSALAVARQTITSPADGQTVSGAVQIEVSVQPEEGEVIDGVDARLQGPGERQLALDPDEQPLEDNSQRWTGSIDPLGGLPLSNGSYVLEVQVRPLVGEPAAWSGHAVQLLVPPPPRELQATPAEQDPTEVVLSWDSVALPDFVGYRIQRRVDEPDGQWETLVDIGDPRQERTSDVVPEPGAYRYRLVVARGNGDGGEIFATSGPRGVRADPEDPGTFTPPRDPDPEPFPSTAPEPDGGVSPVTRPTDPPPGEGPTPAPSGSTQSSGPPATGFGGRPPQIRVPAQPAPAAPAPPVPFNDGVFQPQLPVQASTGEVTITETETAMIDGGFTPGGTLDTLEGERQDKPLYTAIAGGLLLLVASGHVRRFVAGASAR